MIFDLFPAGETLVKNTKISFSSCFLLHSRVIKITFYLNTDILTSKIVLVIFSLFNVIEKLRFSSSFSTLCNVYVQIMIYLIFEFEFTVSFAELANTNALFARKPFTKKTC